MIRLFTDHDGVEWRVELETAQALAQVNGPPHPGSSGLRFTSSAMQFSREVPFYVDPRAVPACVLQRMVDKAFD